jgi:quercetin dioxygenase-like cupin family protein
LILALREHPDGVDAIGVNLVVYDIETNEARYGSTVAHGPAIVWELAADPVDDAEVNARVDLDSSARWLMRCDRVDFPPGAVAHRHTHPGPGIRRLLRGTIRIETMGEAHVYGPSEAWFEPGPEPVLAVASVTEETAFVRVLLLPEEWAGRRTIRHVDPADDAKPKLQRATVFLEEPIEL